MKKIIAFIIFPLFAIQLAAQRERLIYHDIQTGADGKIIPWSHVEPGKAWSHVVNLTWQFWDTMRRDLNGLPYYMNRQVWRPVTNDPRGLGGDQLAMALSSWRLLYAWSGNERVKENMKFIADYYLSHGLSPANCQWPDLPFPYNTMVYSGVYDGDMVIGKGFTQPDKAGSFAWELVNLYKMNSRERFPNKTYVLYLEAAIKIANTLAAKTKDGDADHSPMPFKVNVFTNEVGEMSGDHNGGNIKMLSQYTSNYSGTLELFLALRELKQGDTILYKTAFDKILKWIEKYPLTNNRWGPFFEDIPGWSDTQINAVTFAQFMMNHRELFPKWKAQVQGIFDWVYRELGNKTWIKYGVETVNEQTAYRVPGNSHTSRQASAELQYMALTGNKSRLDATVRQLNWATYMVNDSGWNRYPQDENWLTDGYGDYIRHFLRGMAAVPELAPTDEIHIVSSTSVVQQADYNGSKFLTNELGKANPADVVVFYRTFEPKGVEVLRLPAKPSAVWMENKPVTENGNLSTQGYGWKQLAVGGLLTVYRQHVNRVIILR